MSGSATSEVFGYQGQWGAYTDAGTGLVLMTHRYYDPAAGRFVTRDPIGYAGGINLYGYVGGDPVTTTDPRGGDGSVLRGRARLG
ncbi:MAG TPA: RHS repeat-associated core domain-containing protein [Armatimonadota bacterium]